MALQIGIVGLPNAGKSTLFNALLKKQLAFAANYPFATIEPNVGIVPVPDERLGKLALVIKDELKMDLLPPEVPATVKFVDIAGLVSGASKGEGLGNKFLAHIREVELIVHVLREFSEKDIVHVMGEVDSQRDREVVETELMLADLDTLTKQPEPKGKVEKEVLRRYEIIKQFKSCLEKGIGASSVMLSKEDENLIRDLHLLTRKKSVYVINVSEKDLQSKIGQLEGDPDRVVICAKTEEEVASLSPEDQKEYLKSLGLEKSGLERLIRKAYQKLGLISFLTAGEKEVRAWTIADGTLAPQAAGVIHTDFEKTFIKAEVISFDDFVKSGGWTKARESGKIRLEGKEYRIRDGDVVDFKVGN